MRAIPLPLWRFSRAGAPAPGSCAAAAVRPPPRGPKEPRNGPPITQGPRPLR